MSASPRELLSKIEIGMERAKVEALLGASRVPDLPPDQEVWYLPSPQIEPHESPYAIGTIGVRYTAEGRVASKRLNPQYRER